MNSKFHAPRFALVDVNNFYVSCERNFNPKIEKTPVVVLSNGDGCAVARSAEVKALGVKMGTPWFKMRELAQQHGIIAYSSNYTLYGDMSARVMEILRDYSPDTEVYSIDEAFLRVESVVALHGTCTTMGISIRARIAQWIGLPVCVGFGESKTLAKLANHIAKKNPEFEGVCDLTAMSATQRESWMKKIDVAEVWGVGRRFAERLRCMGIQSALDLSQAESKCLRREFGVVMERSVSELCGISCMPLEMVCQAKQQIMSSRSFGAPVLTIEEIGEAVATYVARAAEKLRRQGSVASAVQVYIQTNRFKPSESQYSAGLIVPLVHPSDSTIALTSAALLGLRRLFKPGLRYKKAGIMLTGLTDKNIEQLSLFEMGSAQSQSSKLMAVIDAANKKFGRDTVRLLSTGLNQKWAARAQNLSPKYTTQWSELPIVR